MRVVFPFGVSFVGLTIASPAQLEEALDRLLAPGSNRVKITMDDRVYMIPQPFPICIEFDEGDEVLFGSKEHIDRRFQAIADAFEGDQ